MLLPVPFVGAVPRRGWPCQLWLPPPAVALLLSGVTSSRAWVELEGEGRAQLVRFHALGRDGGPLYLPDEGSQSASPRPAPGVLLAQLPGGTGLWDRAGTALLSLGSDLSCLGSEAAA